MNISTESIQLEAEQSSSARARENETDLESGHTQDEETSTSQTQKLQLVDRILIGAAFALSILQMVLERESTRLPTTHWAAIFFYCLWVIDISIVISRHVAALSLRSAAVSVTALLLLFLATQALKLTVSETIVYLPMITNLSIALPFTKDLIQDASVSVAANAL